MKPGLFRNLEAKIRRTKRFYMKMIIENPTPAFQVYLQELLKEKSVTKSALIWALNVDRNHGYPILNGTRLPTRVQLLHIAVYCRFDTKQTQRLRMLAGRGALYVRRPEDAKTMHCLEPPWNICRRVSSSGESSVLGRCISPLLIFCFI